VSAYPYGYPVIADWSAHVTALLPDVVAREGGAEWHAALMAPLGPLDDRLSEIYGGVAEIGDAAGSLLDLLGDQVGEQRGGLGDSDYRRLIAARRVARASGVDVRGVARAWAALTAPGTTEIREPGTSSLYLRATVGWTPSERWLVRAAAVVRDVVPAGVDVEALIVRGDSAIFGQSPGFTFRNFAFQLPVRVT
jgi:hypothetical protein